MDFLRKAILVIALVLLGTATALTSVPKAQANGSCPAGYSYETVYDPSTTRPLNTTFSVKVKHGLFGNIGMQDHVVTSAAIWGSPLSSNQVMEVGIGFGYWSVGTNTNYVNTWHGAATKFVYVQRGTAWGVADFGPITIGSGTFHTLSFNPVNSSGRYDFRIDGVTLYTDQFNAGTPNVYDWQLNHEDYVQNAGACNSLDAYWTPLSPLTKASQFGYNETPGWPTAPWTRCFYNSLKIDIQTFDATVGPAPYWPCYSPPGGGFLPTRQGATKNVLAPRLPVR